MGCTSSKENTYPPSSSTAVISDHSQPLINDQFRQWLKSNRPKADEYVLNTITSSAPSINETDDYRPIVRKALDLLADRHEIKSASKLAKLVHKELPAASSKKVAQTIDTLKQTAEKLRHGQLLLDSNAHSALAATNGGVTDGTKTSDNKHGQIASGEPGIVLKEALEKARISFYKGKQAAIFANPNGGYDVRVIDDNDDTLNQDGNLLRSIIVTEVKTRPKPAAAAQFTAPPPPKPIDEHEIGDDFRRSIDAALKGLEAIYQPTPTPPADEPSPANVAKATTDHHAANLAEVIHHGEGITHVNEDSLRAISQTDIQPKIVGAVDDINELLVNTIESTTYSQIGDRLPPLPSDTVQKLVLTVHKEDKQQSERESERHDQSLPTAQTSSHSVASPAASSSGLATSSSVSSPVENQHTIGTGASSIDQANEDLLIHSASMPANRASEGRSKQPCDPLSPPAVAPLDASTAVKSAGHNVTYTEIIHSESQDGEQSRRFVTESYDEQPPIASNDDDETMSRKIVTKSEFSHRPSSGEKTMEQSVQVITVKVRNETVTTAGSSPSSAEKSPFAHDNAP